jgi:hypothetical protein
MRRLASTLAALALTLYGASAVRAEIVFFEGDNFNGRQFTASEPLTNFADFRFNDRARSAIVTSNAWELCADANFTGGCAVLAPGRYPSLGDLAGRVSSARVAALASPVAPPLAGGVTFYEYENFGGRQFHIDQPIPNFGNMRYNDRAQSAIVDSGTWEICVDAEFRGDCREFVPGRYPNLGGLAGRVSSARPALGPAAGNRPGGMRGRAHATLYEGPNLTGRAFVVTADVMPNLGETRFNDRASSLRVDRGYWIFCSDADFRGECRTFGPGEYPTLPWGLDNRISSGRRIANDYPYAQAPSWQR